MLEFINSDLGKTIISVLFLILGGYGGYQVFVPKLQGKLKQARDLISKFIEYYEDGKLSSDELNDLIIDGKKLIGK
jgi:predicted negative regulator of RcsB-dependent stress response